MFKCWEFKGNGDPFFGGSADDRILHRLPDGSLKFVRGCDRMALNAVHATFDTKESALAAGRGATERNGLLSAFD